MNLRQTLQRVPKLQAFCAFSMFVAVVASFAGCTLANEAEQKLKRGAEGKGQLFDYNPETDDFGPEFR